MASIAGGGANSGSGNLTSNFTNGREFIDLGYPITADATLESTDIYLDGVPSGVLLIAKVFRESPAGTFTVIGTSQTVAATSGLNSITWDTPVAVLTGDVIGYNQSQTTLNHGVAISDAGKNCVFKDNINATTSQTVDTLTDLLDFRLSIEAFGTLAGGGDTISITSVSDNEVKQRDGSGQASFTVAGTISGTATAVEYQLDAGAWSTLDAAPTTTFTGAVTVTGQQDISVRFSNSTGVTDTVSNITAAAVIVGIGESTQAGRGTSNQTVSVTGGNPVPIMYKSGVFSALADPTGVDGSAAGSHWPAIAQAYSDAGIPVCIVNLGQGSATASLWTKPGAHYTSLTAAHTNIGGFELVEMLLGANDQSVGTAQGTLETQLGSIVDDINADFGVQTYITYHPDGDNIANTPTAVYAANDAVIAANANAKFGGDLDVIDIDSGLGGGNDGIHLKSNADLTTAGGIIYAAIASTVLTTSINGIPDGTYKTWILNPSDDSVLYAADATYVSGVASISLIVPASTVVKGWVDDGLTPVVNGSVIYGTTA